MKKITLAGLTATLSSFVANAAFAAGDCDGLNQSNCPVAVPEISALEGTAAIAALAAIVLLTWERRRRAH
ncbi:VPEID-CTERM sorting domain-containing protein (plasmid) [Paracoccus sp. TK19116]|uniref:VPEID-CTERM sorting domain-containing protein n=1 Tax=Paracoccus albicereus TaxID=2922394 RepID=A0ABT1MR47_9RHOB|nr:VPEID-CTERM sorting domain-containing protein [Paracoccus albicereus]